MWGKMLAALPNLTKADFEACVQSAAVGDTDQKILTKLFVMCDETGDEVVDAQKFMAVASVLVAAEAEQKFCMAFSFYDFTSSGKISQDDAILAVSGP